MTALEDIKTFSTVYAGMEFTVVVDQFLESVSVSSALAVVKSVKQQCNVIVDPVAVQELLATNQSLIHQSRFDLLKTFLKSKHDIVLVLLTESGVVKPYTGECYMCFVYWVGVTDNGGFLLETINQRARDFIDENTHTYNGVVYHRVASSEFYVSLSGVLRHHINGFVRAQFKYGYRGHYINDEFFYVHMIMAVMFVERTGKYVEHANGDIYDNRASNLRWTDRELHAACKY